VSNWTFDELKRYDDKICKIAESYGLDWFPILYEVCDYFEMIGHMSYSGLPSHYPHWSYGKSFERTHQLYNAGMEGLPYELIINSNPSIAYLMRQNPMALQVLIMAHCVGHSDFFKNNRTFKGTQPDVIIPRIRGAKRRVQAYIEDPSIGIEKVEKIIDAAHSIRFQTERIGRARISHEEQKENYLKRIKDDEDKRWIDFVLDRVPFKVDYDILGFIIEHGKHLDDWERDVLNIIRNESLYFIPQIRTKILNEGWASFWHHKILNELELPQDYHIHFMKSHNQVIRPHPGRVNPYNVGFYLFQRIEKEQGLDRCFFIREVHHDVSALEELIDEQACRDLGLFTYSLKTKRRDQVYTVDDVSDDAGWENIKRDLIMQTGLNSLPKIGVSELTRGGTLVLQHEYDGRELEIDYADQVVKNISLLWESDVRLKTYLEEEEVEL
jgi:stage V sporulation protein R